MTLRITDDVIKDVLHALGPSTASQIYREIINRDSTSEDRKAHLVFHESMGNVVSKIR